MYFQWGFFFPNRPHFWCSVAQWSQYFYEVAFKYVVKIFLCTKKKIVTFFRSIKDWNFRSNLVHFWIKKYQDWKGFYSHKGCTMINKICILWLPDDCLITFWLLNDFTKFTKATDCLTVAWRLPDYCLITASWLLDDCLMTALWLPYDCLMTALWLLNNPKMICNFINHFAPLCVD